MKKSTVLLTILGLLTSVSLLAAQLKGGERVIVSDPVSGNFYTVGGEVQINAPIGGDLVCAGGKIWVNGPIGADLILAGGEAILQHKIGGDVRLASGKLTIEADVAGDLVVAGGELTILRGVTIAGDVLVAGGKVTFAGNAAGKVRIAAGELLFSGKAAGEMEVRGGTVYFNGEVQGNATLGAEDLNIGADAAFYSNVRYWNDRGNANFDGHLNDGASATFDESLKFKTQIDRTVVEKGWIAFAMFRFLSATLLMTLLITFFGRFFARHAGTASLQWRHHLSLGSLVLIGTPLAIILAFATVIGIPIGFMMMGGYSIVLILANSLTAVVATYELKQYLQKEWSKGLLLAVAVGIFLALRMVGMLSLPGRLIVFVATAIAIGAVVSWLRQGWQKADNAPDATPSGNHDDPSDLV